MAVRRQTIPTAPTDSRVLRELRFAQVKRIDGEDARFFGQHALDLVDDGRPPTISHNARRALRRSAVQFHDGNGPVVAQLEPPVPRFRIARRRFADHLRGRLIIREPCDSAHAFGSWLQAVRLADRHSTPCAPCGSADRPSEPRPAYGSRDCFPAAGRSIPPPTSLRSPTRSPCHQTRRRRRKNDRRPFCRTPRGSRAGSCACRDRD